MWLDSKFTMGCGNLTTKSQNSNFLLWLGESNVNGLRDFVHNWCESAQVGACANGELARIGANRRESVRTRGGEFVFVAGGGANSRGRVRFLEGESFIANFS